MNVEPLTFPSAGGTCCGVLYRPELGDQSPLPVVVLAHGFGTTRLTQYDRRARRLVQARVAVLDFDPRFIGTSPGEPRQCVDVYNWLEDLRSAVGFVRCRPDIDAQAVGIYGSSLGGALAVALAAEDPLIRAIALDVPPMDGLRTTPAPMRTRPALVAAMVRDAVARRRGRPPVLLPLFGDPGSGSVIQHDVDGYWRALDELEGIEWIEPRRVARHAETGEWRNETTALELRNSVRFRPARQVAEVRCAVLAHLSEDDRIVPYKPTRKALARIPGADLRTLRGGHFAPFYGDGFATSVGAQIEFFARHLCGTRRPGVGMQAVSSS